MKKNKSIKFRNYKRKAFSLVELVMAIGISTISLVAMVRIAVQSTRQAIKNDAADTATQIASTTADTLVRLRNIDTTSGGSTTIPAFYKSCTSLTGYSGFSEGAFTNVYFYLSKVNSTSAITLSTVNTQPNTTTNGPFTSVTKVVPQITNSPTLTFGKDNILDPTGTDNIYYRSISMQYNDQYKVMIARIVLYWSLYGIDYFYITYPSFSLSSLC